MRSVSLSLIIGLCVRVLNALDLVSSFHHGAPQTRSAKDGGGSWGQGEGTGGSCPPSPHLEPPMLATEAHVCEQLAESRYVKVERPGIEPVTC